MDQLKRTCNQVGHQKQNPSHICTISVCELNSRWVCGDCIKTEIHKHDQIDQRHILNKEDFLRFVSEQVKALKQLKKQQNQIQQKCVEILLNYSNKLKEYIGHFKEEFIKTNVVKEMQKFNKLLTTANKEFDQLDNQQINNLLNINSQNFQINCKNSFQKFKQLLENSEQIFHLMKQLIELNISTLEKVQYEQTDGIYKINETQQEDWLGQINFNGHMQFDWNEYISTCQISQNKQFLVIGGFEKKLQIYDLDTKQSNYSVVLENIVKISKFTLDSKFVILGDEQGYLYQYQIHEFKELYRQKVHQSQISDLVLLDNDSILTCSYDKSIILMNLPQNKQLLKIQNMHTHQIRGIDYDSHQSLIVSCSDDKSIKVFDSKNGEFLFQQENAHTLYIQQVQFIENNNQLISSNINDLFLWQIDHNQKQFRVIRKVEQKNYNVSSIFNNQKICVVCESSVKIYDNQLNLIQEISHDIKDFLYYSRLRQLNSLKYIIIPGKNNLQVMMKQ